MSGRSCGSVGVSGSGRIEHGNGGGHSMARIAGASFRRCRRRATRGGVALAVLARTDPKQRIVITGQGIVSAFGNDVDTFYDKYAYHSVPSYDWQACTDA